MWLSIARHQAPDPGVALRVLSDLALPWQAFLLTSLNTPVPAHQALGWFSPSLPGAHPSFC